VDSAVIKDYNKKVQRDGKNRARKVRTVKKSGERGQISLDLHRRLHESRF
jgi:hypothetical protein